MTHDPSHRILHNFFTLSEANRDSGVLPYDDSPSKKPDVAVVVDAESGIVSQSSFPQFSFSFHGFDEKVQILDEVSQLTDDLITRVSILVDDPPEESSERIQMNPKDLAPAKASAKSCQLSFITASSRNRDPPASALLHDSQYPTTPEASYASISEPASGSSAIVVDPASDSASPRRRRPLFTDRLVKRVFVDGDRFIHVVRVENDIYFLEPELSVFLFDRVCAFGQNLKGAQPWTPPLVGYVSDF